jgi:hypothetical protein
LGCCRVGFEKLCFFGKTESRGKKAFRFSKKASVNQDRPMIIHCGPALISSFWLMLFRFLPEVPV